ncbi:Hypothetical protein HVR_LOCUS815 [uncultured virus]|nr:Hypothetical protein HVR_LOCUS815 [uncultured virus]
MLVLFVALSAFILIVIMILWYHNRSITEPTLIVEPETLKSKEIVPIVPIPSNINTGDRVLITDLPGRKYLSWIITNEIIRNPDTLEVHNIPNIDFVWVLDPNKSSHWIYHSDDVAYLEENNYRASFLRYWDNETVHNLKYLSLPGCPMKCILEIDGDNLIVRLIGMCRASRYTIIHEGSKLSIRDMPVEDLARFKFHKR